MKFVYIARLSLPLCGEDSCECDLQEIWIGMQKVLYEHNVSRLVITLMPPK